MSKSKGWVHWHPDGYVLDIEDDKALGMKNAGVFHDIVAAERWVNVCSKSKKSLVEACEVITYEEAAKRLSQAAIKATAEELRAGRAAMPKATEAEAYAQQDRALRGETRKPTNDRMMVHFRVDPSKYRVGIRKVGDVYNVNVTDREDGATIYCRTGALPSNEALFEAITYSVAGNAGKLLPHPWKRADGSRIKASWEENEEFWANIRKSADMAKDQPAWTSAGIKVSKNFSGGE